MAVRQNPRRRRRRRSYARRAPLRRRRRNPIRISRVLPSRSAIQKGLTVLAAKVLIRGGGLWLRDRVQTGDTTGRAEWEKYAWWLGAAALGGAALSPLRMGRYKDEWWTAAVIVLAGDAIWDYWAQDATGEAGTFVRRGLQDWETTGRRNGARQYALRGRRPMGDYVTTQANNLRVPQAAIPGPHTRSF